MTDALFAPTAADVGAALARALGYLGLALLAGTALVPLLERLGSPLGSAAPASTSLTRTKGLARTGALLLLASAALRLYWQAAAIVDAGAPVTVADLWLTALETRWSARWQVQTLAAIVSCAVVLVPRQGARGRLFAVGLVAALVPLTGHAMAHGDGVALAVATQGLHALAASMWLGTLAVLYVDTRRHGLTAAQQALWQRFSWLARVSVAVVILTGVLRAWDNLGGSLSLLTSTPWGVALLLKVALAGGAAAVGFLNWRRVLPSSLALGRVTPALAGSVGLELLLAFTIFTLTGWLSGLAR